MRTIEEIKAEYEKVKSMTPKGYTNTDLCELEYELRNALIFNIPLDRLEEICNAERDGRLAKLNVGSTITDRFGHVWEITETDIYADKILYRCGNNGTSNYTAFYQDEFDIIDGNGVQEAEKALAEMEESE